MFKKRGIGMDYINRIRSLREDNDYTQKEVARLLNVGQRTYADYEYGKTRIPLYSIIKLARFYDVDMNYICGVSQVKKHFPNSKM
jgi:transcriptional regulator with XRE-family HTH domain